jgi:hypothetical protein
MLISLLFPLVNLKNELNKVIDHLFMCYCRALLTWVRWGRPLVPKLSSRNVRFGFRDLDLVQGWDNHILFRNKI